MFKKIKQFFNNEILHADLTGKSARRIFVIRQIRVIVFAFKGFFEDRAALRATSLTYFTILSLIPILAMAFGIASGFGFEDKLNDVIDKNFRKFELRLNSDTLNQALAADTTSLEMAQGIAVSDSIVSSGIEKEELQTDKILGYIKEMVSDLLSNTSGGLMAGVGFIILFWSVIQVLSNIELSFNDIWQVKKARNPLRKFSDYLAIMIISPFAIALSGSVLVRIRKAVDNFDLVQPLLIKLIPFASIWLLFTLVYIIMPNTKVKFRYAMVAGFLAGLIFMVVQWAFVEFQVGVTKAGMLYGSFAVIPLFLLWLQISWLIVLMGAEISFAYQNIENYELENQAMGLNHDNKRILSLVVAHHIVKNFEEGGLPKTNQQISHELGIPVRLLNDLIFDMIEAGVLAELATESAKERKYQPALDINKLTVDYLYTRLEKLGGEHLIVTETGKLEKIMKIHEHLLMAMTESPSNILIKDI